MHSNIQTFITEDDDQYFATQYKTIRQVLFNLLDTPVQTTFHIGGTKHFNYPTEPILDILVGVNNLHDITALDEKRLNYEGFYRLHHPYKKKVVMAKFNNLIDLRQTVRLQIIQKDSPLYNAYLNTNEALSTKPELAEQFGQQKQQITQHVTTIRPYENQKQQLFTKLAKRLGT